ncbi:D-2-hydroxyacid dehydrogenase family protein [Bifidobacterium pullorum subsp. saeculare]|uniref:D-2-hydroxyacid dehydrogenase family protein n=1 Tax=Bifidobacterium pullorum subsp. saeculare TaxID=78257 RepID=A0A938WXJ1_9BIFI|nr:NAD(P)-dependent oxidoreductase [Bifidobacterium pullorum]MBM6700119.1 D-2-hydroxyacid dehydrogenase family protein [Bifidobacterium pullorum subsp. saeculare]
MTCTPTNQPTGPTDRPPIETQPERTDLPLAALPDPLDAELAPITAQLGRLRDLARVRITPGFTTDEDAIVARTAGADAMFIGGNRLSDRLLRRLCDPAGPDGGHIRCLVFCGTGVATSVSLPLAAELGVRVCNAEHYGDHAVAEHTMALMLAAARRIVPLDAQTRDGRWAAANADGLELNGKRLAIVGLGGIGRTVAGLARAFGMEVSAWRSPHRRARGEADPAGIEMVDGMAELFARADVVSIHLPYLPGRTGGIVTAEAIRAMRPGTVFVNTGRAEVLDNTALLERLRSGDILAGLDVYDHEPLRAGEELTTLPNVTLTPHVAWRTDGAFVELTCQMVEAMACFFEGRDYHVVVPGRGAWPAAAPGRGE